MNMQCHHHLAHRGSLNSNGRFQTYLYKSVARKDGRCSMTKPLVGRTTSRDRKKNLSRSLTSADSYVSKGHQCEAILPPNYQVQEHSDDMPPDHFVTLDQACGDLCCRSSRETQCRAGSVSHIVLGINSHGLGFEPAVQSERRRRYIHRYVGGME